MIENIIIVDKGTACVDKSAKDSLFCIDAFKYSYSKYSFHTISSFSVCRDYTMHYVYNLYKVVNKMLKSK